MAKLGKQHQVERPESRSDEGIQSPSQAKGFSPAFSFVAVVDQTPGAVQILTGSDNDAMPRLSDCESSTVVLDSAGLESVESDDTGLVQKERDQKDQMPEKEEVSFIQHGRAIWSRSCTGVGQCRRRRPKRDFQYRI
jgi:hypothetical protein